MTVLFFGLLAPPKRLGGGWPAGRSNRMSRAQIFVTTVALCLLAIPALAQESTWLNKQNQLERLDADTVKLTGQVEVEGQGKDAGQKLTADEATWNTRTGELTAQGNVLLSTTTSRISAERVTFNTVTKRGTFYTASGISQLGTRGQEDITMFGSLEPDVYFYGEEIEKIGEDKYKLTRGGFTTCVQPTPRWEVVSTTSTINLHDYAILHNAVMHVKDVPVFYLPILYIPIQDDNRATGFLMPTYGSSTLQGQSLSNAFFWAIDRSQDLTLMHDSYFSRGQGYGTEYRYVASPSSNGDIRFYRLATDPSTVENNVTNPGRKAYEVRGNMAHRLPYGLRARGRVDYFSDITTQQLYNQNLYTASLSQRLVSGSISGAWGGVSLTGNYQRSEQFFSTTQSVLNGYTPSIQSALSSRRIGKLPLYYSMNGEVAHVLYASRTEQQTNTGTVSVLDDRSIGRVDFTPSLRSPIVNLPFLSLTSTLTYRYTYYTESIQNREQVAVPLTRNYAEMRAELLGPVFSKVFAPNDEGTRVKHIVEPNVSIQRTTAIDNRDNIVQLGNIYDQTVGDVTRFSYGVTNRWMVRSGNDASPGARSSPRELMSIGVVQSYYTDPLASTFDQQYQSSYGLRAQSNFSPIAVTARVNPTAVTSATTRMEYDYEEKRIQGVSTQATLGYPEAQVSAGWSRRRTYVVCPPLPTPCVDQTLNTASTFKFAGNRYGGTYAMDWDIARSTILQQRWLGYYSAQCCGFTIEYQVYNYPTGFIIPQNRRFNFSFTLAGIGTFSNFFGAFGGNTGSR